MDSDILKAYEYLFENAGPIIRYEAAVVLGRATEELKRSMLEHPQVQYWLECTQRFLVRPQFHNAADTCLENWMHKLLSFGITEADDKNLPELNSRILKYARTYREERMFHNTINSTITISWLACMGYTEAFLLDLLLERIHSVYEFVRDGNYNIYTDTAGYPAIPKARAVHPLVDPALYENEIWKLPTVHDIFAFANLPRELQTQTNQKKIDRILEYILDERYQRLERGYGLMLVHPDKYYSMGWSVHLDGYFKEGGTPDPSGILWAMELMSHFGIARESEWFRRTREHLEQYETDGLYEFPAGYLGEGRDRYYVGGGHMGLGENRREKSSRKIESTAWMLRILRNCSNPSSM